jgi:hypothetical protein
LSCAFAAEGGHFDCLIYLREHGFSWNEQACEGAVKNGHLDCLIYLRENGCPWDKWTCEGAAKYGHLHCLIYAREHGCPWDELTCESAAKYGHLDCLVYAKENGCPFNSDEIMCYGSFKFNWTILLYLIEQGTSRKLPLQIYNHDLKFHFVSAKKLFDRNFIRYDTMHEWVCCVDAICNELCYDDLSTLIKQFI